MKLPAGDGLHVLRLGHDDDELFVLGEVVVVHLAGVERDGAHRAACRTPPDRGHLGLDDATQHLGIVEDPLQLDHPLAQVVELLLEVDPAEPGELAELHLEDVDRLQLAELERLGHQAGLRAGRVVARTDERDDRVDDVERLESALDEVGATAGPLEAVLAAPRDDLDLVADVAVERVGEVERARHAVDERDHVDAEARLQLRQLVEVVEHDVRVGVALQRDDRGSSCHPTTRR